MGVQPMIAHADSQAGAHPVKNHRDREGSPVEHEQSGDRADMEQGKHRARYPVHFLIVRDINDFSAH
jgi:hypothetical protein